MHEHSAEPRTGYDAIIVGAGLHGQATASYLARCHGMTDIAVLDRGLVAWGLACRTGARGVDVIQRCEVTEILIHRGCVAGVETTHGCIEAPHVVLAAGGSSAALAVTAGVNLPARRHALEGCADVASGGSPILGPTPLDGLFVNCGWGTGGLQATPGAGREQRATLVAH